MIEVDEIAFSIIIQLIIVLALLCAIFLVLWRRAKSRLKKLSQGNESDADTNYASPDASTESYLTTEIKITESRFEQLYANSGIESAEITEGDILLLRKYLLEFEKEQLVTKEREEDFWLNLFKSVLQIVKNLKLAKRQKPVASDSDEDEIKELKNLLEQQVSELENAMSVLEQDQGESNEEELKKKLLSISRSHKELSHCVYLLEDENMFLRDQIQSLLQNDK